MNRFVAQEINHLRPWLMKDKFKDQPCFLLGHGPSLRETNLDLLDGFFTAGINWTLRLFKPTFMFFLDQAPIGIEQERITAAAEETTFFVRRDRDFFPGIRRVFWEVGTYRPGAPFNPIKGPGSPMPTTGTSASCALGMLYSLGFDPIIMLGVDFNIPLPGVLTGCKSDVGPVPGKGLPAHATDVPATSVEGGFNPLAENTFFKAFDEQLMRPAGRTLINASPIVNPEFNSLRRWDLQVLVEKLRADGHTR